MPVADANQRPSVISKCWPPRLPPLDLYDWKFWNILWHAPKGLYSQKGLYKQFLENPPSKNTLWEPFSEPFPFKRPTGHLLRTLLRTFCKTLLKDMRALSPKPFLEARVVVRPRRRAPHSRSKQLTNYHDCQQERARELDTEIQALFTCLPF